MLMKIPRIASSIHVRRRWTSAILAHCAGGEPGSIFYTHITWHRYQYIVFIKRPCDIMNNTFVDSYECTVYRHNIPRYVQSQKWMDKLLTGICFDHLATGAAVCTENTASCMKRASHSYSQTQPLLSCNRITLRRASRQNSERYPMTKSII